MNRALLRVSVACLAMFVLLLLNMNYVQAFEAGKLAGEPGNIRVFDQQFTYQRGTIVANGDGTNVKIAESRPIKGTDEYRRYYPYNQVYAAVTGYDSMYGKTGIEQAENSLLDGSDPRLAIRNFTSLLTGKQKQGATISLTISPAAQQAAYHALATGTNGHPGAIVALNPSTGAILAMASYPSFNPNQFTTFNGSQLDKIDNQLLRDPSQPLLNRAINETYPPGSTFKIVTSSAAFSTGKMANPQTKISAPTVLKLPNGHTLHNNNFEVCANGDPPMIEAFWLSCDTAFANIGMKVTGPVLRQYANLYGMNRTLSIPLAVSPSALPPVTDQSFTAMSAIGQYNDTVTPLMDAMFSAAIANHGKLMMPYLVQQVLGQGLSVISSHTPTVLSKPVTPKVAGYIQSMMYQVTHNPAGTGYGSAGPQVTGGINIDGKTGTAQNGINNTGLADAVWTCFVPGANIAVGVIIQGGGYGAAAAAPLAVQVIKAYLGRHS